VRGKASEYIHLLNDLSAAAGRDSGLVQDFLKQACKIYFLEMNNLQSWSRKGKPQCLNPRRTLVNS
jgi:hypothetical protein